MILTLKNLWTRRRQHVWLCVELVLISVVSWFVIDPLFVEVYDIFVEPDGFDTSSLCCLRPMNDYDDAWADPEPLEKDLNVIKNKILEMDEVESLCFETSWFLFSDVYQHSYVSLPGDTTKSCYGVVNWVIDVDNDYFKTYGYKVIAGNPNEEDGAIITRSVAEKLYGKTDVCGATISIWNASERRVEEDVDDKKIIAVIEDVKMGKNFNCRHSIFYRSKSRQFSAASVECILVRLKAGVDADAFCERLRPTMQKELRSGKTYVGEVETLDHLVEQDFRHSGYTGYLRRQISLAIFFMVNLCLGTIGTFWLQTRKRKEEIGIRRSFGASKRRIMREFLTEGFVLTTICHIVGCFLFLQYAISFGLSRGLMRTDMPLSHINDSWLNHFAPHFLAVGTFIYLIILLTVSIGIAIPAWNICRKKPVEALRDE